MTEPDYFGDYWRARLNRAELEHREELSRREQRLNAAEAKYGRAVRDREAAIERAERAERERDHWRIKYGTLSNEIGVTDDE